MFLERGDRSSKVVGIAVLMLAPLLFWIVTVSFVQASQQEPKFLSSSGERSADIVLLNDKYVSGEFSDKIVGEVENNGTAGAEYVELIISFYNSDHSIIGTDSTFAQPRDILPDQRSSFEMSIPDDVIRQNQLASYEIVADWLNPDGTSENKRLMLVHLVERRFNYSVNVI